MADKPTSADLLAEEETIQLPCFNAEIAWKIGNHIRARAAAEQFPIAIEVSLAGHPLFYCAMPGATPNNAEWIRRKRNVVDHFHRSSLYVKTTLDEAGRTMLDRHALHSEDYATSGGAVPVIVKGTGCIGAVAVSGLSQYDDHDLGIEAIRAVIAELEKAG